MLQAIGLKAMLFMDATPFTAAKPLIHKYGIQASDLAIWIAVLFLVFVGIGLMAGSARTRQGLKSHLGWILVGVLIVFGASFLVRWVRRDTSSTFGSNGTILPSTLDQLDAFKALL